MSKRIIAVDLGNNSVKMGEFTIGKGGLPTLQGYSSTALGLDPANEEQRPAYVVSAIEELMSEMGISGGDAFVSVSGQSVLAKYVNFPSVSEDKISEIIEYEAVQNIPFPIQDVVWDYHLLEESNDQQDALIVAIKEDLISGITDDVDAAGLSPALVDTAPMAIYNAVLHNYGKSDDCRLVMDMGARSTDLIFIEGNRLFTRSVPVGGNDITKAIAKELDLDFLAAEDLKLSNAFVSFGGVYEEPEDETTRVISKCVRNVMTRLHSEVMRSVNLYRGQQSGSAPSEILLTGNTSVIPYTDTFLQEKMNLEVSYVDPLAEINVSGKLDAEDLKRDSSKLTELVGLALRASHQAETEVDLLPLEREKERAFQRQQPWLVASLFLLAAALGAWAVYHLYGANKSKNQGDDYAAHAGVLSGFKSKNQKIIKEIETLRGEIEDLSSVDQRRDQWLQMLDHIKKSTPVGLWITSIRPLVQERSKAGTEAADDAAKTRGPRPGRENLETVISRLQLTGLAYNDKVKTTEDIKAFFDKLQASDFFDKTPQNEIQLPPIKSSTRSFSINLLLKDPIAL